MRLSLGDKGGIARCLEGLARVAPAPIVAARLLGAASKLREDLGYPVPPSIAVDQDRYLDTLRTAIGGAFPQVWNEARALTLDEAVGEALNITSGPLSES
jgi:hypothetical protein